MSYLKQYGTSAKGNDRLLKSYGGNSGSSPMARQKYASGGAVKSKDGNPSLAEGMSTADGAPAKPSLARPGRKMPGKGGKDAGKKGTTVNIVIAGKSPDAGPKPDMPMAGGPPPPHPMPMPPPGAGPGGPPMPPMRANGGRIANLGKFAHGGKVKSHTSKSDEAEDKDVRGDDHEFAKGGKVCRAEGGPAIGLHEKGKLVGAGGAAGRLAKAKMYGK